MKKIMAVALLALVSAGVSAEEPAAPAEEKKICKTEKVTGSRTRTERVCLTQAQWRELQAKTRKGLEEMGQTGAGGYHQGMQTGPGGPG